MPDVDGDIRGPCKAEWRRRLRRAAGHPPQENRQPRYTERDRHAYHINHGQNVIGDESNGVLGPMIVGEV